MSIELGCSDFPVGGKLPRQLGLSRMPLILGAMEGAEAVAWIKDAVMAAPDMMMRGCAR